MRDSKFNFWQKWLTLANIMTLVVGLILAFAGNSFVFKIHNSYTQNVFFNGEAIIWFFIDSGISIYTGALYNVVIINLVALFLIGLPLVMTRKVF